jgi:hypothetical protein
MGLFGFLKPAPIAAPLDLHFESGLAAVLYAASYMRTDWKPHSSVVGFIRDPVLHDSVLVTGVLIPNGNGSEDVDGVAPNFREIITYTNIKAVSSPATGRVPLSETSTIDDLDLRDGDLVTVILAGYEAKFLEANPGTCGWIAFVVAKNALTYSILNQGWVQERKFEM